MAAAIGLRDDFDADARRAIAKRSQDGLQARRLLALAAIYDGATRNEAAKIGRVGLRVVRDWVLRFNALGPDGLIDRKAPGQPSRPDGERRAALARMTTTASSNTTLSSHECCRGIEADRRGACAAGSARGRRKDVWQRRPRGCSPAARQQLALSATSRITPQSRAFVPSGR